MTRLDNLALQLAAAKLAEENSRARRIEIESAIVDEAGCKPEGSMTTAGDEWKVTTTGIINRTVDEAALPAVRASLPAELFDQAVEYVPRLKVAGLRYLQNNEPQAYAVLAQAITAKPGKASVRVERVDKIARAA